MLSIRPPCRNAHRASWVRAAHVATLLLWLGFGTAAPGQSSAPATPVTATRPPDVPVTPGERIDDERVYYTTFSLQVTGKLRTLIGPGQTASLPLQARAEFAYWERHVPAAGATWEQIRLVRFYERASSEAIVADRRTRKTLRPDRRLIAVYGSVDGLVPLSLEGRLNRDELDLLQTPLDTAAIPYACRRLPASDEPLSVPLWLAPTLTGLEAIRRADVRLERSKHGDSDGDVSGYALRVTAEGAVTGAPSKISGSGTLRFDPQHRFVDLIEYRQTEQRDVGTVTPGLDVTATISVRRAVRTPPEDIAARLQPSLPDRPDPEALRIEFPTPWGFRLMLSRDWYLFHQTESVAVLRLVRNGHLVAQCNLSAVPAVRPGTQPALEEYEQNVREALGRKLQRLERVAPPPAGDGIRCLAVLAHGTDSGLKMRWLYYLCTAPDGRQAGLVIAVEESRWPQLKDAAAALVSGLRFD